MRALNDKDVSLLCVYGDGEKFMRHGVENVPDYMDLRLARRFYRCWRYPLLLFADEALYGALTRL